MSKLNHLFNAEKILCYQMHQKWGDNVMKACLSIKWSLSRVTTIWMVSIRIRRESVRVESMLIFEAFFRPSKRFLRATTVAAFGPFRSRATFWRSARASDWCSSGTSGQESFSSQRWTAIVPSRSKLQKDGWWEKFCIFYENICSVAVQNGAAYFW